MKITFKKSLAVILSLVMCVSVLFGMNLTIFAAENNVVNYVYDGTKVYNWGQRGDTATFLSPMALDFYADNNISLDALLALNGSSTESGVPSSALYKALQSLMKDNHDYITGYDATKELFKYTDCQNGGGKISSFYSGTAIGPEWNSSEWNREHVWPNSKGDKAGNGENDLMMLRPTSTSENSSRGNKAYGTTTTTSYYNPNDEGNGAYDLRGDCARIILYQYVRWNCTNTGSSYNPNGIFGSNGVIESKDVLLDWIEADPVDTWELGRNDAAESILGTRNVFVDYPELAFDLFNEAVPTNYTSPSGGTSVEGTTGTGGSTGGDTGNSGSGSTATEEIVFDLGTNGTASHSDGSSATSYTETVYNYTLTLSNGSSFYTKARDAKGNSAIKLGTSKAAGSFSMTVPDEVTEVVFAAAQYKANTSKLSINGTQYTLSSASDNGAYDTITIDTSSTKTISVTTVSGGYRCMIDSITYKIAGSSDEEESGETNFVDTSDVVISGSTDAFPTGTTVTAAELTSGTAFNTATSALADVANKFKAYDITAPSQPTSALTLTLAIPSGYDTDFVYIAYIADNGDVEILDSSVNKADNTVSATIEHFSTYAVIEKAVPTTDDGGSSGGSTEPVEIVFNLGANGNAEHKDGSTDKKAYSETVDGYTLDLTEGSKCYPSSYDAKGNSAIKLGTSSAIGSFNMTVPNDVTKVIFKVAKYKTNTTKIDINGTQYTISTSSNDGAYTAYEVDTTSTKTITFKTVSGGVRCMIDSITYVVGGSSGGTTPDTPTYTVAAESSNTSHGTATLDGNLITAKAKAGYEISGYSVNPTGAAKVTDNGDGTFTVSDVTADVTVTINFVALPSYTATFTGNTANATISKYSGGEITLPQYDGEVPAGSIFDGWLAAGESEVRLAGSKYTITADITFTAQFVTSDIDDSQATESTITFDTTDKRTTYSSEQQIWQESGIIVTNNKASSTTAIGNYAKPARFYKNSELIVSLASPSSKITKIVFNANTTAYATTLASAIAEDDNYVVSTNSKAVTITFTQEAVYSFEVTLTVGQVQLDSISVYTAASSGDDIPTHVVKFVENGKVISSLSAQLGSTITLPSNSSLTGEVLTGWLASGQTEPLAPGSSYTVLGDVTFTAKYQVAESGGSSDPYIAITTVDQLKSGTYKMAAIKGSDYYYVTGTLSSGDLVTSSAVQSNNIANIFAATDAANVVLTAVEGKANTYTIKIGDKYLSYSANNSFALNTTATEWTATEFNGQIIFAAGTTTYFGTSSTAASKLIRNYASIGTNIGSGIAFLAANDNYGGSTEATGEIKGAQVSVGSDLSLNYYVSLTNVSDIKNVVMKFTLDGKTTEVACNSKNTVDGKYIFALDNIPPQAMTATITAVLLDGDNVLATLDYTIKQNALNLLATYANDEKLNQFIVDMLYYGAEAQKYTGYNTGSLANAGVAGTPSSAAPTVEDKMTLISTDAKTESSPSFRSANVYFDSTNKLVIKINNSANATLKVNGKTVEVVNGVYTTDGILATQFGDTFTFELLENGAVVQTLTYSINAYAYSKWENSSVSSLAQALYRYGISAKAYAESIA